MSFIKQYPVLVVAGVNALLALVLAFGVTITQDQTAAILGVVNALLALAAHLNVTPISNPKP